MGLRAEHPVSLFRRLFLFSCLFLEAGVASPAPAMLNLFVVLLLGPGRAASAARRGSLPRALGLLPLSPAK